MVSSHRGRDLPGMRARRLRVIAACVLVVVVAVGVLGGIAGLELVAAPSAWVPTPDLASTWQGVASQPVPSHVAWHHDLHSPRPPPVPGKF